MKFLEKQESPKNSKQAVRIPQGKRDAQANVADRVDRKRVGNSPHASRENGPDDKMRRLTHVSANVGCAADQSRDTPAREEDSADHHEGNRDGRDLGIHQLDGSFSAAEPRSSGKSAEHSKGLKSAEARWGECVRSCGDWHSGTGCVQRSLSSRKTPPTSTVNGIQKWMSVAMAR